MGRPISLRHAGLALGLAILVLAGPAAAQQRLLYGRWQGQLAGSAAALTIITADAEGWVHGTLYYEPPLDGFAGAPFTTRIETGSFTIRLANGTRYEGLHWCRTSYDDLLRARRHRDFGDVQSRRPLIPANPLPV